MLGFWTMMQDGYVMLVLNYESWTNVLYIIYDGDWLIACPGVVLLGVTTMR
jgi:hypothetical protein